MKIEIVVKWEDSEGMEHELNASANTFESAEMELGRLERNLEKIQYRAEMDAERAEEDKEE